MSHELAIESRCESDGSNDDVSDGIMMASIGRWHVGHVRPVWGSGRVTRSKTHGWPVPKRTDPLGWFRRQTTSYKASVKAQSFCFFSNFSPPASLSSPKHPLSCSSIFKRILGFPNSVEDSDHPSPQPSVSTVASGGRRSPKCLEQTQNLQKGVS